MTRPYRRVGIGVAAASAVAVPAAAALAAQSPQAHSTKQTSASTVRSAARVVRPAAQVRLASVSVSGTRVTVKGSVAVTPNTAAARRAARVVIKVDGAKGYDRYLIAPTSSGTFTKTWTTNLTGKGRAYLRAEVRSGTYSGTEVVKPVTLPVAKSTTTKTTPTAPTTTVTTPAASPITTTTPTANEIPLVGTFQIGTGSTFEMFTPGGAVPVPPGSLALTAGSDGGLETFGYQAAPSPGFDAKGNALASRIIKPLPFDGVNFTVDTQPNDVQGGAADPVPTLYVNQAGQISGQVTAWDAQWNNQNFNQGTPKPDGTTPGATTKVSGTYNWATGAYSVDWKSLIVSGPFNNFVGTWHLQGTFAPARF